MLLANTKVGRAMIGGLIAKLLTGQHVGYLLPWPPACHEYS
jgi:hypothetical protein